MWWGYNYGHFWSGMVCFSFIVVFWLGIALLVLGAWRWRRRGWYGRWRGEKSAEELLAERYARGEIEEEEYTKRLDVLTARRKDK